MRDVVFLPSIGFVAPGHRLSEPIAARLGAHVLTLREFVVSPDAAEIALDVTYDRETGIDFGSPSIVVRDQGNDYPLRATTFSTGGQQPGVMEWHVGSRTRLPPLSAAAEASIAIPGLGEARVRLRFRPYGGEMESSRVEAAATHDGITVAVRQIAVTATQTALDLELRGDNVATFMGIGGYHNLRLDGTALILRDQTGAQYRELVETARARRAVFDRDFAVFEPLSSEARSLELAVPYVFVEEARGSFEIELPVDAPASGLFGTCLVRVLSVHTVIAAPEVHNPMYRTRSLGAQIDAGGWQGERRLLLPARLLVDRAPSGIRLAKGIDCVAPEPVDYFEAADEGPSTARTLTLLGPIVQVRGPWSVRFARP